MSTIAKQIAFIQPNEGQMYELSIDSGIYAGRWAVDTQLLKTHEGIFKPYNEKMTLIEAYHKILTDKSLIDAELQLVPAPVMVAGIQHDRNFYKKVLGTYQLTGSGVVTQTGKYLLGTPRIMEQEAELAFNELRSDEPIARIKPQNGKVEKLDKIAFWGIDNDFGIESEKVRQPTHMWNAQGPRFVGLYFGSCGVVAGADWRPLDGDFDWGARLARKLD